MKSIKIYFKYVPLLNSKLIEPSLCIPITLFVFKFNIGAPDEPFSVEHLCLISYLSKEVNNPYETAAFFPTGY